MPSVILQGSFGMAVLLVAARLAPLFFLTPLDFVGRLPGRIRLMIILALSLFLVVALGLADALVVPGSTGVLAFMLLTEVSVGLVLSLGLHALVGLYLLAGRIMDLQTGLGAAAVFNPAAASQDALLGTLLVVLGTTLFFVLDMHHHLIALLVAVFGHLPPGTFWPVWPVETVVAHYGWMFSFAVVMAAPILVGQLLVDVAVGLTGRNMPQFNVYFVMLPLKIAFSLGLLALCMPLWSPVFAAIHRALVRYGLSLV